MTVLKVFGRARLIWRNKNNIACGRRFITMAELSDVNVLCKFDEGSVIQSSGGFTDDFVIFTSTQRISVYRIDDHQLVHNWFVKSGQQLTSPAVQLSDGLHYSVIIDRQIIQSWGKDDHSIDHKSQKIQLSKPAHQLFPLNNGSSAVLYEDGTVGFTCNPTAVWGQAETYRSVAWCRVHKCNQGTTIVAVFETFDGSRRVLGYTLTVGEDSVQSVDLFQQLLASGVLEVAETKPITNAIQITGYSIQFDAKAIFLITLYETGRLKRTMLVPGSLSSYSITVDLDPVSATQRYLDITALSELLVATVRYDQNQNTAFFEIWDVKYTRKHSEAKADLSNLGQVQHLRKFASTLLLVCELGTAVVSFEQKPGDIIWASGSHQLHQDIQTPTYEVFRKEFSELKSFMETNKNLPTLGSLVMPKVDAIIHKVCDTSGAFWPAKELSTLVKTGYMSERAFQSLLSAAINHRQLDLLHLCLKSGRTIPEALIAKSLECILQKENTNKFSELCCTKEELLNLVLCLRYEKNLLIGYICRMEFSLVLDLIQHLCSLWDSGEIPHIEICKWMYLLSGTHLQQFNLFPDYKELLSDFYEKITTKVQSLLKYNIQHEVVLDEAKLQVITQNNQRHCGYYISSFVHPFDD